MSGDMIITLRSGTITCRFTRVISGKPENKMDPWPETILKPEIFVNDEPTDFEGVPVDCTGCSQARRSGNKKLVKQCFDWIIDNAIG